MVSDDARVGRRRVIGKFWCKRRENGVWIGPNHRWRLMWHGHDSLYVAAGRLRVRLMKPSGKEGR